MANYESTPTNWDGTLTGDMINFTENRDSVGYDKTTNRWYAPSASMGYDPYQRGMGVDIRTNQYVKPFLKKDAKGTYLTAQDERYIRHKSLDDAFASYKERVKHAKKIIGINTPPSETKQALTINAIYNLGAHTVASELFEDKPLMQSLLTGSDEDYAEHVIRYFVKHNKRERPSLIRRFMAERKKQQVTPKPRLIPKKKTDSKIKWNLDVPQYQFPLNFNR